MSKSTQKKPEIVELTTSELESLFQRLDVCNLDDNDKRLLKGSMQAYIWMKMQYERGKVSIHKLARLLFGSKSEKNRESGTKEKSEATSAPDQAKDTSTDLGPAPESCAVGSPTCEEPKEKAKGHGRMGANAYPNAEDITLKHPALKPGDPCPEDCGGKLYSIDPGVIVRITGQDFAKVTRYHIEKLRCGTCGLIVKASLPEQVSETKYDYRFKAILAVQKYFLIT